MDMLKILIADYKAEDHSFLYYLHEEDSFNEAAFSQLCDCISSLCSSHPCDKVVYAQIAFIYGQVLKHIIYHFDPGDSNQISNFPCDYNEKLEVLEGSIAKYFNCNASLLD